MSSSISFVDPDNLKSVVNRFLDVARANILDRTLHPTKESLASLLQAVWARTFDQKFANVDNAKKFIYEELSTVPSSVTKYYENSIESSQTVDKIKEMARLNFNKINKEIKSIITNLSPINVDAIKEALRTIWTEAQKLPETESLENRKQTIIAHLNKAKIPQNLKDLYAKDIGLALTVDGIGKRLGRYLNDLEVVECKLISTSAGSQGYPKLIYVQRHDRISGFMKTLGPTEMDVHLLYSFLLEGTDIHIPKGVMFDVRSESYINSNGKQENLSKEYNDHLKRLLSYVASANTPRTSGIDKEIAFQSLIQTNPAGFFERVEGMNLSDFFTNKYSSLSDEQKEDFFSSVGKIACLDLILGNQDRFIKLIPEVGTGMYPSLDSTEDGSIIEPSNLGNLMISLDSTKLYVVDSVIGDGRTSSSTEEIDDEKTKDAAAYLDFLKKTLERKNFSQLASQYIIKSIEKSITESMSDAGNFSAAKEKLQPVLLDLSNYDSSLQFGIKEMERLLLNTIIPRWNGFLGNQMREKLNAELVKTIQTSHSFIPKLKTLQRQIQPPLDLCQQIWKYAQFLTVLLMNSYRMVIDLQIFLEPQALLE